MAVEKYSIGGTVSETEAFEASVDDARITLPHRLVAEVQLLDHAGAVVLHEDVVGGHELQEQVASRLPPEVDG